ncbi:MAG: hypothetical protein A3F74_19970 [Betaproteobacteria bacterium RIFCSPLOWO2_12_FULL_62_58]|nr:MAG: hypothetical protein A3F74_19970 [Betaproteobacteria bacterium RIFCSPLOWO2_12_FULL_62_58]
MNESLPNAGQNEEPWVTEAQSPHINHVLRSWSVRRSLHGRPLSLTDIPVDLFCKAVRRNLEPYPRAFSFWWPIICARAERCPSAADLLLNPFFRWAFLNRADKLTAFEEQIAELDTTLGAVGVQSLGNQMLYDLQNVKVENNAHNRILSSMVEVRCILRFACDGYSVALIPRHQGHKTPDFSVTKESEVSFVEAKYIRPPDKLGEYLLRWWQAQKEVAGEIPLGILPHLRFEWEPVERRSELSQSEIDFLKQFFVTVLHESHQLHSDNLGSLIVRYVPDRKLPISTAPLVEKASQSELNRAARLFEKLKKDLKHASGQLAAQCGDQRAVVFLALNLSPDITFLWPVRFDQRLDVLRQEFVNNGVNVLVEEVG